MDIYQQFIAKSRYSRFLQEDKRRENWEETVDRYMDFMKENLGKSLTPKEYSEVREGILNQDVCPSMRLLWSAGNAAKKSNVWAYNCSYVAPSKPQDFGEIMYILMCGAGLGSRMSRALDSTYLGQHSVREWPLGWLSGLEGSHCWRELLRCA